jgi:hypothetical protein
VRFRNDTADDQGGYEFTPLDGGTHFLSVSATQQGYADRHPAGKLQISTSRARDLDAEVLSLPCSVFSADGILARHTLEMGEPYVQDRAPGVLIKNSATDLCSCSGSECR